MQQPIHTRLQPPAARVLAVTAQAWGLGMPVFRIPLVPGMAARRPAPARTVAARLSLVMEALDWPYWPAYPGAAAGWR